jgi:hypothetical protein
MSACAIAAQPVKQLIRNRHRAGGKGQIGYCENAGVAQSVEQLIRNQQVECSNHFASSKQKACRYVYLQAFCYASKTNDTTGGVRFVFDFTSEKQAGICPSKGFAERMQGESCTASTEKSHWGLCAAYKRLGFSGIYLRSTLIQLYIRLLEQPIQSDRDHPRVSQSDLPLPLRLLFCIQQTERQTAQKNKTIVHR